MSKIIIVKEKDLFNLEDAIKNYCVDRLENSPTSVTDLMQYYLQYADPVYSSMRKVFTISFEVIDNEIRAMLGHCVDIDLSNPNDRNLEKAYSHFRRMNIDSFKIICDEFDKFYTKWFKTHYKCDFSNMRKDFLQCIASKYYKAKSLYVKAQHQERVGSDLNRHKVLEDYSNAALAYVDVYKLYAQYRADINRIKFFDVTKKAFAGLVAVISLISGFVTLF